QPEERLYRPEGEGYQPEERLYRPEGGGINRRRGFIARREGISTGGERYQPEERLYRLEGGDINWRRGFIARREGGYQLEERLYRPEGGLSTGGIALSTRRRKFLFRIDRWKVFCGCRKPACIRRGMSARVGALWLGVYIGRGCPFSIYCYFIFSRFLER